jgi:hypothetical protein
METNKTYPAQIVFDGGDRWCSGLERYRGVWNGKPLNPSRTIDRKTGKPISRAFEAKIWENSDSSGYGVMMRCRDKHGTRYTGFKDFTDAQKHLIKWFARNFVVSA